ncbi:hypothetical protein BZZ01_27390 [Nostocales cyanobacterium HT-58-2]|nr:hypothetical protein BZZ01_27390 [Nostocales cyanobacterium HT-58-2]
MPFGHAGRTRLLVRPTAMKCGCPIAEQWGSLFFQKGLATYRASPFASDCPTGQGACSAPSRMRKAGLLVWAGSLEHHHVRVLGFAQ